MTATKNRTLMALPADIFCNKFKFCSSICDVVIALSPPLTVFCGLEVLSELLLGQTNIRKSIRLAIY